MLNPERYVLFGSFLRTILNRRLTGAWVGEKMEEQFCDFRLDELSRKFPGGYTFEFVSCLSMLLEEESSSASSILSPQLLSFAEDPFFLTFFFLLFLTDAYLSVTWTW